MPPINRCARSLSAIVTVLAAAGASACGLTPPEGEARGPAVFETCTACHGAQGEGMQEYGAPAIAGLPEWYLTAQLEKFRTGARGAHADDVQGLRMRGMARTLVHEGDVESVAALVAALPPVEPAHDLGGDAARGEQLFAPCVECHGARASGNEERGAPPLTGLDDWYVVTQLSNFRAGIRGTAPADTTGATMRPMAMGLPDEQAMRDVAAYVRTLREAP